MNSFPIFDKSYKLLVYIGIALTVYTYTNENKLKDIREKDRIKYDTEVKYIELESDNLIKEIKEKLNSFFSQYNILQSIDSIESIDSVICMLKTINENESNAAIIQEYLNISYNLKDKIDKQFIRKGELEQFITLIDEKRTHGPLLFSIGYLLLIVGIVMWHNKEAFEVKLLKRKSLSLPTFFNNCQSCGKRFNSMVHYGTETLSKRNYHFCSECYRNGYFTEPNMTLNGMKIKMKKEFIKKKKSRWVIYRYLQKVSNLERWK